MTDSVGLSSFECADLLRTDVIGRVAFVTPVGPRIVPVNYTVNGDAVEFRTSPHSELAAYAFDHDLCFEIDHVDPQRQRGWSVVAIGPCDRVEEPFRVPLPQRAEPSLTGRAQVEPATWDSSPKEWLLRLQWREISGRRVGGPHWPHPVVSGRARAY